MLKKIPSEETLMKQASKCSTNLEFALREHHAGRMHIDLTIGCRDYANVADFVIPKPKKLSELIGSKLAIPQPEHSMQEYLHATIGMEHIIKEGYGKGVWTTVLKGSAKQVGDKHSFILTDTENKYKYTLKKFGENKWLIQKI